MNRILSLGICTLLILGVLPGCDAGSGIQPPDEAGDNVESDCPIDAPADETKPNTASKPGPEAVPETGDVFWTLEDGVLTIGGSGVLLDAPWQEDDGTVEAITEIVIGNGITDLPYSVFRDYDSLTTVTVGNGLTYIPAETFIGCENLEQVNFGENVTFIDGGAFERCGLEQVTIPKGVTFINIGAFAQCTELADIVIPASVTEIGEEAFAGCDKLTIHAPFGSCAEQYAVENGIEFSAA